MALELNLRYSKEEILELYLNKISFTGNSYGVEQSSRRLFAKPARDLTVLESAILASLPKSPTAFSPYNYRDRLMGYVYYEDNSDDDSSTPEIKKVTPENSSQLFEVFHTSFAGLSWQSSGTTTEICGLENFVLKSPFSQDDNHCEEIEKNSIMDFLNALQLQTPVDDHNTSITIEYEAGRKDRVLMRMYEDGYINDVEFSEALVEGLDFVFQDPADSIRYPHFVFYVREYLESLYGAEFFEQGGWKIYTTIDPKVQDAAQGIIDTYAKTTFANYGINNGALVVLDNNTRDIIAMIGSQDYYNKDIDGEVNIITSLKQPGSSMKPIIYARAFENNSLSTDTPIFDVEMSFGDYKPKNYDGKFLGPMTIRTALNASRNITAIKMWYLSVRGRGNNGVDQEYDLVSYLQNMGLTTIKKQPENQLYGPPIALGSAEVRPLDFADVYASFANNGVYKEVNPIIKIVDGTGNEIFPQPRTSKQIILPGAAYMITNILSDSNSRPSGWNNFLALSDDRRAAVKTGTSSKKIGENTLPRDLWTVGYTPQYTTVVWTGNTDGKVAAARASGMETSALIWKKVMESIHHNLPKEDFARPDDVEGSEKFLYIEGKKPEVLSSFDPQKIQIDTLCDGQVNEQTPKEAIREAVIMQTAFPIEDAYP